MNEPQTLKKPLEKGEETACEQPPCLEKVGEGEAAVWKMNATKKRGLKGRSPQKKWTYWYHTVRKC